MTARSTVAITGVGLVTPLATGTAGTWEALLAGRSGTGPLTRFRETRIPVRAAGEVRDLDASRFVPAAHLRHVDRYGLLAIAASRLAIADAGLDPLPPGAAVYMGVGLGGLETIEAMHSVLEERGPRFVTPWLIPMIIPNMAAGWVSILAGAGGPTITLATACASSAHAVGEAFRLLRGGGAEVALAGGAEAAITPLGVAGFHAMRALSTREVDPARASCPFDVERDGFVLSEGAAVLVLESEGHAARRSARTYARITGYGAASDAFDPTQPDPSGEGAIRAMTLALEDASLEPSDIGYVNAHATSTPLGDRVEAAAIRRLLGRVPVSSTKGATGHLLGGAGALEAGLTALALHEGVLPHTLNLVRPDPDCDLEHVVAKPRRAEIRAAISNAFGFGGTNATLVIERGDSP